MTRVLVVDDEPSVLRGMKVLLTLTGHASVLAESASQAMSSEGVFDVGIFDLDLGSECGIALARRMLESGRLRRALFCTGCADPERVSEARRVARVFMKGEPVEPLLEAIGAQRPKARTRVEVRAGVARLGGSQAAGAGRPPGPRPTARLASTPRTELPDGLEGPAPTL
jgi:DNA-binding NarL/FixJ family response regulator